MLKINYILLVCGNYNIIMSTATMYINNTIIQLSIIDYSLNREGWAIRISGIFRDKTNLNLPSVNLNKS